MSSTTDFFLLSKRISSFNGGYYTKNNKEQAIINLAVCGFHFTCSSDPGREDEVGCHVCLTRVTNWNELATSNVTLISSKHTATCVYYQAHDVGDVAPTDKDVRTSQSTKHKFVDSAPIRVLVGAQSERKEFSVHEDLICPRSVFFRNAMEGPWKEQEERSVPLPEDEPEVFSLYLELLYTDALPVKVTEPVSTGSNVVADEYATLSKLFVLAEKLMDDNAKVAILAAISARSKELHSDKTLYYPAIDSIQIIYDGTPNSSPARQLLVSLYTDFVTSAFVTEMSEAVPKDFLYDLSISLLTKRPLCKALKIAKGDRKAALDLTQQMSEQIKRHMRMLETVRAENAQVKAENTRSIAENALLKAENAQLKLNGKRNPSSFGSFHG